jgi:1-hydroxycarotenoid 3,4-desaturase
MQKDPGRVSDLTKLSKSKPIVVIGGGIGGLVSALDLASAGLEVILVEKEQRLGGKIRQIDCGGKGVDSGPTVFTMRWVFDGIFQNAGCHLDDVLQIEQLKILARHAWSPTERLDLFANREQSAEAIRDFAGAAEADRFMDFCLQTSKLYRALEKPYMLSARPSMMGMMKDLGPTGSKTLYEIGLFNDLWKTLSRYFKDPRLHQLFARYATYCGSSPLQAPATLMLIADVEMQGVWAVEGGMIAITQAITKLAEDKGVQFITGVNCEEIIQSHGKVSGVRLSNGNMIESSAVIFNGDVMALQSGLLGQANQSASPVNQTTRSLSALTWSILAKPNGFPLVRHNVFFNKDYASEFTDIFYRKRLPQNPTVYICAQDQTDTHLSHPEGERILCLVNAPATGDRDQPTLSEIESCQEKAFSLLKHCGLDLSLEDAIMTRTTPQDFHRLFPATGGALYGQANHGWMDTFRRPAAQTTIPGLYLAGGSAHPGAGVPMAALSGRMAAATLMAHLGLIKRSGRVLISGGMSTH